MSSIFSKKETGINKPKSFKKTKNEKEINSLSDDKDNIDQNETNISLSLNDIIKSIPLTATKHPNVRLQTNHTEWRWRFFDIKGRKLIEISKKDPNSERVYMDNTGKWILNSELKDNWDKFLTDTKYSYGK